MKIISPNQCAKHEHLSTSSQHTGRYSRYRFLTACHSRPSAQSRERRIISYRNTRKGCQQDPRALEPVNTTVYRGGPETCSREGGNHGVTRVRARKRCCPPPAPCDRPSVPKSRRKRTSSFLRQMQLFSISEHDEYLVQRCTI